MVASDSPSNDMWAARSIGPFPVTWYGSFSGVRRLAGGCGAVMFCACCMCVKLAGAFELSGVSSPSCFCCNFLAFLRHAYKQTTNVTSHDSFFRSSIIRTFFSLVGRPSQTSDNFFVISASPKNIFTSFLHQRIMNYVIWSDWRHFTNRGLNTEPTNSVGFRCSKLKTRSTSVSSVPTKFKYSCNKHCKLNENIESSLLDYTFAAFGVLPFAPAAPKNTGVWNYLLLVLAV